MHLLVVHGGVPFAVVVLSPSFFASGRGEEAAVTLASIQRQLDKNAQTRPEWQRHILVQLGK